MSSRATPHVGNNAIEPFVYRPAIDRPVGADSTQTAAADRTSEPDAGQAAAQARRQGYAEAEQRLRTDYEAQLENARSRIEAAIGEFARQRESYFARVEEEVVNLSLSIARKILHREAQIDPLVLVGLVHVALQKLGTGTRVRLRVNPETMPTWEAHFRGTVGPEPLPELVADTSVEPEGCQLETDVGTTIVGLETHLKEIEQGFFDLLAQRPR